MKKYSRLCKNAEIHGWTRDWQAAKVGTCMKHVGELKSHASCCTIGQNSQVGQAVSSRLELASQSSREAKLPDQPV